MKGKEKTIYNCVWFEKKFIHWPNKKSNLVANQLKGALDAPLRNKKLFIMMITFLLFWALSLQKVLALPITNLKKVLVDLKKDIKYL